MHRQAQGLCNPLGSKPARARTSGLLWTLLTCAAWNAQGARAQFEAPAARTDAVSLLESVSVVKLESRADFEAANCPPDPAPDVGVGNGGTAPLPTDPYAGFGDNCSPDPGQPAVGLSLSADCNGAADTCTVLPEQTNGNCTALDCLDDASVCPPDWSCFDTSTLVPGLPSACAPPPADED